MEGEKRGEKEKKRRDRVSEIPLSHSSSLPFLFEKGEKKEAREEKKKDRERGTQ